MTITFRYPIVEMFSKPEPMKAVAVRYIPLTPKAGGGPAQPTTTPRARATPPARLPNASSIPVGIPAPAAPTAATGIAIGAGGTTAASGRDPGIGFGIRPGIPDGRLAMNPSSMPVPQTEGQKAERALAAIYSEYLDSARAAMNDPRRKPGDWSWGGKDGDKWGWDKNGIHVGGITIPNVVLAALPIQMGPTMSPVDVRANDFVRADIKAHAGLMTEDEFRAAVKRVRDRVDRERSERMAKEKDKAKKAPCCS